MTDPALSADGLALNDLPYDESALTFYRLRCGCVVLLVKRNHTRLMRRIADAKGCSDFPEDARFHCWRPDDVSLVCSFAVGEVVSVSTKLVCDVETF